MNNLKFKNEFWKRKLDRLVHIFKQTFFVEPINFTISLLRIKERNEYYSRSPGRMFLDSYVLFVPAQQRHARDTCEGNRVCLLGGDRAFPLIFPHGWFQSKVKRLGRVLVLCDYSIKAQL